jgi:hypothetical protein
MKIRLHAALGLAATAMSPSTVAAAPHRYDHVVIVIEENTDYGQVIGDRAAAPFINELADNGVNFSQFYAITHPSQPNYLHLFSGDHQGVIDDTRPTTYPWTTANLGAALLAAGATFAGYSEDLPFIGDRDTIGVDVVIAGVTYKLYRRKHNPWANWQALEGQNPIPVNQLPFNTNLRWLDFPADYAQLPDIAFVIPNEQNDMHDGTIRMGDDWLRANLAGYAQWAHTHNSLLVITFDEDNFSGPNKIPTVFHGAGLTPGTENSTRWTLHNLLRTLEDMHGTTHSARGAQVRPITGVFPGDPPVLTVLFQQGLNAYDDCTDTMLRMAAPTSDESAATALTADLDTDSVTAGNQPAQILIRFDNLFGPASGQVPLNATIISAKLCMWTGAGADDDSDDLASCHRMLVPWIGTDTWNSLVNGVQTDDIEAVSANTFTQIPELEDAPVVLDVTNDVAAFLAGVPNHGWVLNCTGADSWRAVSMEGTTITQRPTLQIAYTIPITAGYPAWQLAKFGANAGSAGTLPPDDPDTDSAANLLEYALNANPLRAFIGTRPTVVADGATFRLNFIRNLDATDITLRVEATRNLDTTPWSPVATWTQGAGWITEPGYLASESADAVTITFIQSDPGAFFRLAVTLP